MSGEMNWSKVIENLRDQSNYYAGKANEYSQHSGHYDLVKEMRASANIASILCAAFSHGLITDPLPDDKKTL